MTTLEQTTTSIWRAVDAPVDEAQLAAAAFLARYSGRTLDATIYDRRRENFDRHAAYVVVAFVAGG